MTPPPAASIESLLRDPPDFSFILGGPLFQLLRRARLTDDALTLLRRRIVVIMLFAWLPLLLLSTLEGQLLGGAAAVPFLMDVEVHVRFLVAMPLLIFAELAVHRRMRPLVRQFLERDLVPRGDMARFEAAISSAIRLRNSVVAEVLMIAFVYLIGIMVVWREFVALDAATWYATPAGDGSTLSLAGLWYIGISVPFFQFLLCRWFFRIFVWARFLWQVSRVELNLFPTHPDRTGGLAFLSGTVIAFVPLLAAHGAMVAGYIANRIFYAGAALTDFKLEIGIVVAFMVCLVIGPLTVFGPQLVVVRRRGNREYGMLAQRYVREFDHKWLRRGAPTDEAIIGSADIQSLADLGNSMEIVQSMRTMPVTRDAVVQLAGATLAPIVPLLLTMMPLEDLLHRLFGILF